VVLCAAHGPHAQERPPELELVALLQDVRLLGSQRPAVRCGAVRGAGVSDRKARICDVQVEVTTRERRVRKADDAGGVASQAVVAVAQLEYLPGARAPGHEEPHAPSAAEPRRFGRDRGEQQAIAPADAAARERRAGIEQRASPLAPQTAGAWAAGAVAAGFVASETLREQIGELAYRVAVSGRHARVEPLSAVPERDSQLEPSVPARLGCHRRRSIANLASLLSGRRRRSGAG
jgi:hypothetical protein